ncbi:MAG: hypothetical protein AAF658_09415, partial [Myxococcota bacterium]
FDPEVASLYRARPGTSESDWRKIALEQLESRSTERGSVGALIAENANALNLPRDAGLEELIAEYGRNP